MRHPSKTWSAEHKRWMTHKALGATVTRAPKRWRELFGALPASRGLKVVSIVYDWKVFN